MTENENSPENLRKFLESDDPALVRMGLSMAKVIDLSENLKGHLNLSLAERLWVIMKSNPIEENRTTAMELLENNEEEIHEKELMIRLINDEKTSEETKTKFMNLALHTFDTKNRGSEIRRGQGHVTLFGKIHPEYEEIFWDTINEQGYEEALISIAFSDPEWVGRQPMYRAIELIKEWELVDDDTIEALISATWNENTREPAYDALVNITDYDIELKQRKYIAKYIIEQNRNDYLYEMYTMLEEYDQVPYLIETFYELKRRIIYEYGGSDYDSDAAEIIRKFLKSKDTNISSALISKAKEVLEILEHYGQS
jgi:hypothetical protein